MRLYHHPMSSNARRAVMTAIHLDAKVDLEIVDLAQGAQRRPDFLSKNPNGKVPVLDDDGFLLWESHAIMQYLADKTPGQTVYPTEIRARADVNRWLFWSAHHWTPAISVLGWENFVKAMIGQGDPDPVAVERGEGLVTANARVLDEHLRGKKWIAQDRVTLADLAIATPLMVIAQAKLPVNGFANVMTWFRRVEGLDAWKKTCLPPQSKAGVSSGRQATPGAARGPVARVE
jgi:glutathione S-transferase